MQRELPSKDSPTISIRAMDEDHLHVVEVLQYIHPYIGLMRIRRHCP